LKAFIFHLLNFKFLNMSFFGNLLGGNDSPKAFSKEESFCAILLAIIASDGHISEEEANDFRAVVSRVNLLKNVGGAAFKSIIDKNLKALKKDGVEKLVELGCSGLPSPLHSGVFVIACDLVFSDGEVDSKEIQILETIKSRLTIDDDFARKTVEVMKAKGAL
jgi:hypothetical protein